MVDAAGAIYVLGGYSHAAHNDGTDNIVYQDVWVSTDGGARANWKGGWSGGY